jgi:hypothetical protein
VKAAVKIVVGLIVITLLTTVAVSCGGGVVAGSGVTQTFEMNYTNFSRLEIGGGFDVTITQADAFYVGITIDTALYEYLNIAQRGDTLHIGLKSNYTYPASSRGAKITLPDLRQLDLTDGAVAKASGFSMTHNLDIILTGGSRAELASIEAGDTSFHLTAGTHIQGDIKMGQASIDVTSGSTVKLTGGATGFKIKASSGSTVTVDTIQAATVDVDLRSGSQAAINVTDLLDVRLSEGSKLTYTGNPKMGTMEISSDSKFNQVKP